MLSESFDFSSLIGASVQGKDRAHVPTAKIATGKKALGLYFSAHWCPPCRRFTPKLAEFYETMRDHLEIVFVSSDSDESQWSEYFASMPWFALPYSNFTTKSTLSNKFNVNGIPCLILLDPKDGSLLTADAVQHVYNDPAGSRFPFKPVPLAQALMAAAVPRTDGKPLVLYISPARLENEPWGRCDGVCGQVHAEAHHNCTVCPDFQLCNDCVEEGKTAHNATHVFERVVPMDAEAEALRIKFALEAACKEGDFEVVMLSLAETREEYVEHVARFAWPCFEFEEGKEAAFHVVQALEAKEDAVTIVVLNEDLQVLNKDATVAVKRGAPFPFADLKVVDLGESMKCNGANVVEKPSLIAFLSRGADEADVARVEDVLNACVAQFEGARGKKVVCSDVVCTVTDEAVDPAILFFSCKERNRLGAFARMQAGLPGVVPDAGDFLIFDNKARKCKGFAGIELTVENVVKIVKKYLASNEEEEIADEDVDK
ncbi:thioredoxin-like-domain-containing protein [Chytriomyces sp. MP71]|nr:thioredoxin-like-domain-containing protein [Chytriomyces sp. MP71]